MRDSIVANAAKESAQAEFPHGLLEICTVAVRQGEKAVQGGHSLFYEPWRVLVPLH
jgi:hypothetical protein